MNQQESIFTMLNQLSEQLDRPSVVELVELYFENTAATLARFKEAAHQGKLEKLSQEAHALKSSSANLGAVDLSAVCLKIEKSPQLNANTQSLIDQAHRGFEEASAIMKKWITNTH